MDPKCSKCGIDIAEEAKFCPICGHDLAVAPEDALAGKVVFNSMQEFDDYFTEGLKRFADELGLTKVDRKNLAMPGMTDEQVDGMKNLSGTEKMVRLVKAWLDNDHLLAKALSEGTNSAGGFLVPTEFRAEIIKAQEKPNTIRSLTRIIPVGRDTGEIPTISGNVTMAWTAENSAIASSDATFGQLTWNINKLAGLNYMSRELFDDAAIGIGDLIVQLFAEAAARELRNVFITGSGSGKPEGLQNATGLTAYAQAGASLAGDDIISMYHSLPSQYRSAAVWFMHDDILEIAAKLKDTTNRYLLRDSLAEGQPQTIKGRPVVENEFIPTNLGVGTDESLIFFGVPTWYYLFDRAQMIVEFSTEADNSFKNHQFVTKVVERLDGKNALGEAWVKATGIK